MSIIIDYVDMCIFLCRFNVDSMIDFNVDYNRMCIFLCRFNVDSMIDFNVDYNRVCRYVHIPM